MKILLVDDEVELTDSLSKILSYEGYQIDIAHEGYKGIELALQNNYDLLILDWMLPGKSGLEICQELRDHSLTTPVLFLTAKDTIDDRVIGLDAGADDYLIKPFELRELLARVRALLRRIPTIEHNVPEKLKFGNLELDQDNQLVYRSGKAIELSEKELELLEYFMSNSGQLLTHEEIYNHLWKNNSKPSSNVVAALIRLLRRKVEVKGEPNLIHTVYGKGYRFGDC
ncbi:MAG: response regulator transcription factor [Xenococcaceae cyanobacterium MO_167.B52]|nr:response regulator transcription factor [Xenococcaceae cyanobacterium MO_167.B52]